MPPPPHAGVVSIDVLLRPDELLGAWRPDTRRLLLPTREPLRLDQCVAARITLVGLGVAATITGRVSSGSRHGHLHRIELVPDELRARALERLVSVARGQPVEYQTRAPRFVATLPVVVHGPAGSTYMTTFSVSASGCALAWSGSVPAVGAPIDVRLGAGNRAAIVRGVVCWAARSGRSNTVGVRFLAGAKGAWEAMFTDVRLSGAPLA